MAFGLYSLLEACLLIVNAMAVLNEERFLSKSKLRLDHLLTYLNIQNFSMAYLAIAIVVTNPAVDIYLKYPQCPFLTLNIYNVYNTKFSVENRKLLRSFWYRNVVKEGQR